MLNGRTRLARRIVAGASISALAITLGAQSASHAEPTIPEVEQRVGALYHEAEAAQERLNEIRHETTGKKQRLRSLRRDLKRQRSAVEEMSDVVAATIADEAQSGAGFGATSKLLLSENPDQVIDGMVASEAFADHQGTMLTKFANESDQLALHKEQVAAELEELEADRKQIAEENETVEAKLAEAEELLSELEAEKRERLSIQHQQPEEQTSRGAERQPLSSVPVSGRAAAAVDFALAQVGDAYVYGAVGPDAYDCSGLTMAAWAAAGVSLPHSSSAQMGSGTPVSYDQLQPGDLVFYYSPVSHVGIYVGNGQLVHAANPSTGVSVTSVGSMPFSGAVRPG